MRAAGKNQLCRSSIGNAVLSAMKHNHEKFVWHCRLCLLMPDHLHGIFAFPREPGMETKIKNWKKYVAGKHGVDWQRDFLIIASAIITNWMRKPVTSC